MGLSEVARRVAGLESKAEARPGKEPTLEELLAESREELPWLAGRIEKVKLEIRILHYLRPKMCECTWHDKMEQLVANLKYLKKRHWEMEMKVRLLEHRITQRDAEAAEKAVAAGGLEPA